MAVPARGYRSAMPNPQQPELRRNGENATVESHARTVLNPKGPAGSASDPALHTPEENQPGHHPDREQDKPNGAAFAERLGVLADDGDQPA